MTWPNDRPLTAVELNLLAGWHEWQGKPRPCLQVMVCDDATDILASISEALGKAIRKAEDEMAWRALTCE